MQVLDHQVVQLMMSALNHYPHEAKSMQLDRLFRIGGHHCQFDAVRQIFGLGVPAKLHEFADARRNHAFNGVQRSTFACHRYFDPVVEVTLGSKRVSVTSFMSIKC
jgi:hypothetical protein